MVTYRIGIFLCAPLKEKRKVKALSFKKDKSAYFLSF